jgi:hypothetical protein
VGREIAQPEDFGEIAPLVLDLARDDFQRTIEAQGSEFHFGPVDFREPP